MSRFPVLSFGPLASAVLHPRCVDAALGSARGRPQGSLSFRFIDGEVRWGCRKNICYNFLGGLSLRDGDATDHPRFPPVRDTIPTMEGVVA